MPWEFWGRPCRKQCLDLGRRQWTKFSLSGPSSKIRSLRFSKLQAKFHELDVNKELISWEVHGLWPNLPSSAPRWDAGRRLEFGRADHLLVLFPGFRSTCGQEALCPTQGWERLIPDIALPNQIEKIWTSHNKSILKFRQVNRLSFWVLFFPMTSGLSSKLTKDDVYEIFRRPYPSYPQILGLSFITICLALLSCCRRMDRNRGLAWCCYNS